ncbi:MAG: beta-phosphoglucomutase-like phosphatase (HAD superfamily) [Paracoccaceae bacterium]|jgi:beta-phosphoglucomutase-like phosphatase (HAD superfamily)
MPKSHSDDLANRTAPAALLFDCDGTLLLTADLHFMGMAQAMQLQGLQLPRDWYMGLTGLDRTRLFERFMADFGVTADLPRFVTDSVALTVRLAGQARENPRVAALARATAGVLPIAVVTNSEGAITRAFLRETALADLFNAIITVEDAALPKPAPDLYQIAARRLGVAARDCLALEDSDQGIQAAEAAGMRWIDVRSAQWPDRCNAVMACLKTGFAYLK